MSRGCRWLLAGVGAWHYSCFRLLKPVCAETHSFSLVMLLGLFPVCTSLAGLPLHTTAL